MPRAKNLREAYNNFYVEPLKEDQEFKEFYVERQGVVSPMIDLKDRMELAAREVSISGFQRFGQEHGALPPRSCLR